jgi:hypothetical protein
LLDKDLKEQMSKEQEGVTLVSKAFNSGRRSFHVKLDISKVNNSISVWLVERSKPIIRKEEGGVPSVATLNHLIPLKFSSNLIEIELADPGIKNRKTTFFFTFAHGSN